MTATNVRCVLVASGLAVLATVLAAAYLWRGYSHPAGELFNKNEWSVVQGLQLRSKEMEFRDEIRISPNVSNSGKYDAIGLPRLDGQGWVWVISNAAGIPQIKLVSHEIPRTICQDEFERIEASVRLNADVTSLLRALTRPDCSTAR